MIHGDGDDADDADDDCDGESDDGDRAAMAAMMATPCNTPCIIGFGEFSHPIPWNAQSMG